MIAFLNPAINSWAKKKNESFAAGRSWIVAIRSYFNNIPAYGPADGGINDGTTLTLTLITAPPTAPPMAGLMTGLL